MAIRDASITTAKREDFRIVHASVQGNHIHLIVEAQSKEAIACGMRGFQISAAMHLNNAVTRRSGKRRRGTVFPDRYHMRVLTSPLAVRHALAYVLNNWRKHGEDRSDLPRTWKIDPFSSGIGFSGWRELEGATTLWKGPPTYQALWVWLPKRRERGRLSKLPGLWSATRSAHTAVFADAQALEFPQRLRHGAEWREFTAFDRPCSAPPRSCFLET
jgi:REP element-mobilizing transposase RayT